MPSVESEKAMWLRAGWLALIVLLLSIGVTYAQEASREIQSLPLLIEGLRRELIAILEGQKAVLNMVLAGVATVGVFVVGSAAFLFVRIFQLNREIGELNKTLDGYREALANAYGNINSINSDLSSIRGGMQTSRDDLSLIKGALLSRGQIGG